MAELFVKCMRLAPCYGPSLAYVDRKETDTMWATSLGRTAQTHEYHMLHAFGVFAWQRILCQWNQSTLPALEPGVLMTRACSLAAMGHKCPEHQRDPHPGYENAMRLFMMALQPAQAAHYVKTVLIPACPGPTGAIARPFGLELAVTVGVHAIGHSAGSYGAMVLAAVLEEPALSQTLGSTKVTAIAMPQSLLTRRYRRQVKIVHVEKDELCVWHPRIEDIQALEQNGILVVYVEGAIHWLGGKKHNYGHFTVAELPIGTRDIHNLLNNEGVLPRDERNKAATRLMSWCTFRMPYPLRGLLSKLSSACALPSTEDMDLVLLASRHGAPVETAGGLKSWLIGQLNCYQHLRDYQGVVGSFLMDLALPITIYLLDYFLPQLNPTERCINTLDIMAAPIQYSPQLMTFTYMREDADFAYYAFTNMGGNVMVMTPGYADQCSNYVDYVQYYDGKPLEVGRMIAILFEQMEPRANYAAVGLITEIKARNRPERLKKADQATQATPEFAREVILSKCNARTYEVALLRGLALEFFAAGPCAKILHQYPGIQMYELAGRRAPHQVRVFDVFALGQTKPAKELL